MASVKAGDSDEWQCLAEAPADAGRCHTEAMFDTSNAGHAASRSRDALSGL